MKRIFILILLIIYSFFDIDCCNQIINVSTTIIQNPITKYPKQALRDLSINDTISIPESGNGIRIENCIFMSESESEELQRESCKYRKGRGDEKRLRMSKKREIYIDKQLHRQKMKSQTPPNFTKLEEENVTISSDSQCVQKEYFDEIDDIFNLRGMELIKYIVSGFEDFKNVDMPKTIKEKNALVVELYCQKIPFQLQNFSIADQIKALHLPSMLHSEFGKEPMQGSWIFQFSTVKPMLIDILNTLDCCRRMLRSMLGVHMKEEYRSKIKNTIKAISIKKRKVRKLLKEGYIDIAKMYRHIYNAKCN
jgi:hypothetical protein